MGVEQRGRVIRGCVRSVNRKFSGRSCVDELKSEGKPFDISKREVWKAFLEVKKNKGAPGMDGVGIEEFEADLKNNLYKIWNRMSSGTYYPVGSENPCSVRPPRTVRRVTCACSKLITSERGSGGRWCRDRCGRCRL
jgi:hypothetical protein